MEVIDILNVFNNDLERKCKRSDIHWSFTKTSLLTLRINQGSVGEGAVCAKQLCLKVLLLISN